MKKWKIGVGIAALVAAISTFVIMLQIEKNALSGHEKTQVYVAVSEIPKGTELTEGNMKEYVGVGQMETKLVPERNVKDTMKILRRESNVTIPKGTVLGEDMFVSPMELPAGMKSPVVVGVQVSDLFQVAGGILRAGDKIHICVVSDMGEADIIWENVVVERTFHSSGGQISKTDTDTAALRINLYMEKNQVERFYEELAKGSLRAVKVCD